MGFEMFVYLFLFLAACSDYMVTKVELREPDILVHPSEIDFGSLISGQESDTVNLTIINTGDDDLYVQPVELSGDVSRYTLHAEEAEFVIGAGELAEVPIDYVPATFEENEAKITIYSSDEDEPVVEVPVIGLGDAPVITVDPAEVDYGLITIGCDNEERITIGNIGNLPLEVTSVTQMVTQPQDIVLEYGSLPAPPWTIDPGDELDFLVSYVPEDTGIDLSEIIIQSSDPLVPEVITEQTGDADVEQWVTDKFEQEEIPLLDVLWVIDNSGSMNMIQSSVASHIDDFMTVFLAASPDYHMAFITTDSPAFEGGTFLDMTTPSPELIAASIVSGIGTGGSGMERGIQFASQSTSSPMYAGPGGSFFREDATLVIIFVSDEPDHSVSGWSSYLSHFDGLKDSDKFLPVAIVGDYPSGCTFSTGAYSRSIAFGAGYYDLVTHYTGQFYSVCAADWGIQMEDLASTVSTKRIFGLSEPDPIKETIEVYVNGQQSEEWEYDSTENHVAFAEGKEPDEGDTIEIIYATWGCD